MQLQIDCIEWVLKKIEVNRIPNDRLEGVVRTMIKDLEKRKDKAMKRPDTDDLLGGQNLNSQIGFVCYSCYYKERKWIDSRININKKIEGEE